ncbi:LAFA_0D02498g1_1 [Lachancea sp. 'fantastica']|nr:LAFA_0D02498g1_1 [Lachancea sp. 'fantastica']
MSGFSLSLKSREPGKKSIKRDGKKKRSNVFDDADVGTAKKAKIRLTHVDEYKQPEKKKLVIKPIGVKSSSQKTLTDATTEKTNDLKFGLNTRDAIQTDTPNARILNKASAVSDELHEATEQQEYEEVPIEDFGDALLRGMGWNGEDDSAKTSDNSTVEKSTTVNSVAKFRPALLGLGAKAGRGSETKETVGLPTFLPVTKVNKKTGERLAND